jgi:hypothetical protein
VNKTCEKIKHDELLGRSVIISDKIKICFGFGYIARAGGDWLVYCHMGA